MSKNFLTSIDLNKNELLNVRFQHLASHPNSPPSGLVYFNTSENCFYGHNGSEWIDLGSDLTGPEIVGLINSSASTINDDNLSSNVNDAISQNHNHSNKTILDKIDYSGISGSIDLINIETNSTSITNKVDKTNVLELNNSSSFTPSSDYHPATKKYVDDSISGAGGGDMLKAIYDSNDNGKVDNAEQLYDGTNIVTAVNAADAVSKKHTHSNKALLDTYTQTEINLSNAVSEKHTQNTDTCTSAQSFQIDSGNNGPRIKNSSGELQIRNSTDSGFASLRVNQLYVEGTPTQINSNEVNIGDSTLLLNANIDSNTLNSDGGISIKRLQSDNSTRADAELLFNNSTGRWQTTMGPVESTVIRVITNKHVETVGDNSSTSFVLNHYLGTRDVNVTVRETSAPYEIVMTDIECTSTDCITVKFAMAPTTDQYTVTIIG